MGDATMPVPRRRPNSSTTVDDQPAKRARTGPGPEATGRGGDDSLGSDVELVEVIEISDTEPEPVSKPNCVIDISHAGVDNLYFAIVRGMVRGRMWSGITSCPDCAYSAIRFAPIGASSYVVGVRKLKDARTIVHEESIPAQIAAHDKRSVDPELLDIIMYTDGSVLDSTSKMVQKVWMDLTNSRRRVFSGYGVFFSQDCAYNSCGPVPGEQNVERSELYAVCIGLETIVEHMAWAGRVLVRTDARIQHCSKVSRSLAKSGYDGVKNSDIWRRIGSALRVLETRKVIVVFEWIKSHAMSWGNFSADKLAKAGKFSFSTHSIDY